MKVEVLMRINPVNTYTRLGKDFPKKNSEEKIKKVNKEVKGKTFAQYLQELQGNVSE